jgi:hypothetical protein
MKTDRALDHATVDPTADQVIEQCLCLALNNNNSFVKWAAGARTQTLLAVPD